MLWNTFAERALGVEARAVVGATISELPLPGSFRTTVRRRIAQVLETQFPEITETQPELLAHHYTEAGLTEKAVHYWHQAGHRAIQRSAHVEAISHLTKVLALLQTLPKAQWNVKTIYVDNVLFLEWTGDSALASVSDGVDTFIFQDGLIQVQTIRCTFVPKGQ